MLSSGAWRSEDAAEEASNRIVVDDRRVLAGGGFGAQDRRCRAAEDMEVAAAAAMRDMQSVIGVDRAVINGDDLSVLTRIGVRAIGRMRWRKHASERPKGDQQGMNYRAAWIIQRAHHRPTFRPRLLYAR